MFGSMGEIGKMAKLFKDASQLKGKIEGMQNELAGKTVEGSAGGGMVRATANGRQEIMSVVVEDEVYKSGDREMLQELVAAACNVALERARELAREEMSGLMGGMGIDLPGIL